MPVARQIGTRKIFRKLTASDYKLYSRQPSHCPMYNAYRYITDMIANIHISDGI